MANNIDRVFKEKLGSYSSLVSPGLWEGIDAVMLKQRRRKRVLFMLFLFVFISSLIGVYYTLDNTKENQNNDNIEVEELAAANFGENSSSSPNLMNSPIGQDKIKEDRVMEKSFAQPVSYTTADPGSLSKGDDIIKQMVYFERSTSKVFKKAKVVEHIPATGFKSHNLNPFRCNIFPEKLLREELFLINFESLNQSRTKTLGDCFDGPPNRFMLGFNAAMDFPFRSINGINGGDLVNYVDQRNQTESEFISFNAGLQAGYFHSSGFLIRGGLQYTQINERFLYVKENVVKIQTQITIDTMINSDGSYTITRDTTISEIIGREEMKTSNHFRMLDIPLVFGYTFDLRKFSLEINGGVIFNVTSKSGGRIFNTELVPSYYGIKGSSFQPYKTYFGLSLYGSITLLSNFYGNTQFFIEPNARYYMRSFSSPDYPIRQNYIVVGLSTGARYYF